MTVSFQEINPIEIDAKWPQQPFHGFSLDSRKVETGQIFIALTSYSQPEKTRTFAETALANGALAVISETKLDVANEWVCPDVRQRMGSGKRLFAAN